MKMYLEPWRRYSRVRTLLCAKTHTVKQTVTLYLEPSELIRDPRVGDSLDLDALTDGHAGPVLACLGSAAHHIDLHGSLLCAFHAPGSEITDWKHKKQLTMHKVSVVFSEYLLPLMVERG